MPNPLAPQTSDSRRTPFLTDRDNAGAVGFQKGVNPETLGTHTTPSLAAQVQEIARVSLGAFADKREPDTFKPFDLTAVTTEQTIWDPAAGKKFRVMGLHIRASATTKAHLIDGTAGTVIYRMGLVANIPADFDLGKVGIVSSADDLNLMIVSATSADLYGTVWGVEEE